MEYEEHPESSDLYMHVDTYMLLQTNECEQTHARIFIIGAIWT